jgi:hypothetical protein
MKQDPDVLQRHPSYFIHQTYQHNSICNQVHIIQQYLHPILRYVFLSI